MPQRGPKVQANTRKMLHFESIPGKDFGKSVTWSTLVKGHDGHRTNHFAHAQIYSQNQQNCTRTNLIDLSIK